MKNIFIFFQIAFFSFAVFSQGLNDVHSPSAVLVYAAGNSGQVLKSTNAGSSYSRIVIGIENLNSVYSTGNTVWCAGDNGFVSVSTDFGVNWTNSVISSNKLNSVYFADSLIGFIAGDNGSIYKSTNGGVNWSSITSGVSFNLNKVKFNNILTGYCCGYGNQMLKTTNGGANWLTIPISPAGKVKSFDVSGSMIIAGGYTDIIYKSTDNGSNWSVIDLKILSHPAVNSVDIISSQNFNVLLESGSIWNTTNSGLNFSYSMNDFRDELNSMCRIGTRSYAVSRNQNVIERSLNSGVTWALPTNTSYTISFIELLPAGNQSLNKVLDINYQSRGGLFVLQREKLYRTLNSGLNWELLSELPMDSGTVIGTQLMVNITDSSKMLAGLNYNFLPAYCKVFRTIDYGSSWTEVFITGIDGIGNFMNQDPQHPDTVYLGARDSVFRSTNYGATWSKICEAPFQDWCDITVKYDNSQILYGSTNHYPAKLNKSTNGGLNWFFVDFVTDTNYSEMPVIALSSLRPDVLLHAQLSNNSNSTGLKRSYTSGNSWLFNQFPGTSWSVDIAKDDPNLYAYGGVSYDPIFLSTNSGGNFAGSPNIYAEQLLYYDRANLFVNNNGTISKMKVIYNMPIIGIENISNKLPEKFLLKQNYPNPFNPETNINFSIAKSSNVKLVIYDVTGREVITLADEKIQPGIYNVKWDASNYPSGIYFYRMITESFSESKKMILIK